MLNHWETAAAAASSAVLRGSVFIFLRWIPGHHFPPIIIAALIIYLTVVLGRSRSFGSFRPSLREAFPAVFHQRGVSGKSRVQASAEDIHIASNDLEDPVIYQDEYPFIKTLLFGVPDWREWEFSYVTIGLNVLLALLSLDLVFRGPLLYPSEDLRFSRVGFVDVTSARVLFREPDANQFPVYVYIKPRGSVDWTEAATAYYAGPDTDFTYPLQLTNLVPNTAYDYSLSNNLTGAFQTAPQPGSVDAQSLTFLTSSCIKANFPYRLTSNALAIHGFEHLSRVIRLLPSTPAFMLFLGDFIYVDVPQRLSSTFSHYRSEYRRVYASPSWRLRGLDSVPWLHTLDDHEIANDWSAGNQTAPFPAASDPFVHYHVSVNPPVPPASPMGSDSNTTYFQFSRGPASFFMLDTRRYRTRPEQPVSEPSDNISATPLYGSSNPVAKDPSPAEAPASMLGQTQLDALLTFLRTPEAPAVHWKIVASSVPFTKNWRFGTSDTWGGFLTERSTILQAMHEAEARLGIRVVILSGDRHEFAAIRFPPPTGLDSNHSDDTSKSESNKANSRSPVTYDQTPQSGPHEFSVGPLSMFYLPIRTFKQVDEEDVSLKYLPDGNSKIGVIDIHNLASTNEKTQRGPSWLKAWRTKRSTNNHSNGEGNQQSILKYSLWIDGVNTWEYTLTSPGPKSEL